MPGPGTVAAPPTAPDRLRRKVVAYMLLSLDGVAESPGDWVFDFFDEEMNALLAQVIAGQDAVLMGRTTYETWSKTWPQSTRQPFASFINATPKYIASTTLSEASWFNSTVLPDVAAGLTDLRAQPGGEIGVHGSIHLVRWLLDQGLLDELKLVIFPVIAGAGERLFVSGRDMQRLQLLNVKSTGKGVVLLTYRMADPSPA